MEKPRLPAEILDMITMEVADLNGSAILIHSPLSLVTKTLISISSVCKTMSACAQKLLYSRCLYIDSLARLEALLRSYKRDVTSNGYQRMKLAAKIAHSRHMYLSPSAGELGHERRIAKNVKDLFRLLAETLKTLIVNMPLRADFSRVTSALRTLRHAFRQLHSLEHFVSIKDELFLGYHLQLPVWCLWRHLKSLALYNVSIGEALATDLSRLPELQEVVFTRPDCDDFLIPFMEHISPHLQIKLVDTHRELYVEGNGGPLVSMLLRHIRAPSPLKDSATERQVLKAQLMIAVVPNGDENMEGNDEPGYQGDIVACQQWVLGHALSGTL